jgi:hypothetical protein
MPPPSRPGLGPKFETCHTFAFFQSDLAAALQRNPRRDSAEHVPEGGLRAAKVALQLRSKRGLR